MGAPRITLEGKTVGYVTQQEAEQAIQKLADIKEKFKKVKSDIPAKQNVSVTAVQNYNNNHQIADILINIPKYGKKLTLKKVTMAVNVKSS